MDTMQKYARAVYTPTYMRVGWSLPRDHNGRALQATVLRDACRYAAGDCVSQALARFTRWLNNDMIDRLPPEIRSQARAAAIRLLSRSGGGLNLSLWAKSLARTADRAGMLLCGDVPAAFAGAREMGELDRDLVEFTYSAAHVALRNQLGLARG